MADAPTNEPRTSADKESGDAMRTNRVREILSQGGVALGTMITEVRNPSIAKMLADAGFDFVFIDMEHGSFGMETVADMILVARLSGLTPLVRVPDGEYHLIARVMDAGAQGVMVPRVETRAQVEKIVASMKYPPVGVRGLSASRGHNDFQSAPMRPFTEHLNRENLVICQIERVAAVDDIDGLLSVPGVDVALIGPNDLAMSLGVNSTEDPAVTAAIEKVMAAAAAHSVTSAIHIRDLVQLKHWMARGMRLITCSTEIDFMLGAARAAVKELREAG